jgi:hypothetical protein
MDSASFTVLIAVTGLAGGAVLCWLLMRGRSTAPTPQAMLQQAELAQAKGRICQLDDERKLAIKNYEDLKHETARVRSVTKVVRKDTAPPAEHDPQVGALQAQLVALQAQEQASRADAAKARSEAMAHQTQAKDYFRSLEKNQQAAAISAQALKLEADQLRQALDRAQKEQALAAQKAAQVPALQAQLAALQSQNQNTINQQSAESVEALKRIQARVLTLEQENATLKRSTAALAAPAQAARTAAGPTLQATQLPALEEQVLGLQNLEKAIKKEFLLLSEIQRNVTLTSATRHEFLDSAESRTTGNAKTA